MTAKPAQKDRVLRTLLERARKKGFLSFQELVASFPAEATADETKRLIDALHEHGIRIRYDKADRWTRQPAPRRQFAALLTREEEVALAHKIRDGWQRRMRAALRCPTMVQAVIRAARQVDAGKRKLWDVLADFEGSHPDQDDQEALEQLMVVANSLKNQHDKLTRLLSPQAARKKTPTRQRSIGALRGAILRSLKRLDFREGFIIQLLKPLLADAARARAALSGLARLELEFELPAGSLGGAKLLPDADMRKLLRAHGLRSQTLDEAKRRTKKHKRALRSVASRTGLDATDLLTVVSEVHRGEDEANRASQAMVEANQRLVISIARRYPHHNMDFLDLVQEGNLGLMRAADRFDPGRGFRFGTYAAWWVRQSIGRLVAEQGSAVRIPPHVQESLHKVNRITRRMVLKAGKEPSIEELAEMLDKTPERIKEILAAGRRPVSTETHVGDSEDSARLLDFLPDPHAGPDEEADQRVQQSVLQEAMDALTEREQDIIALRFQQGLTLQEVGDRYGITRERTRQLQAQALQKMRKRLKADLLRKLIRDEPLKVYAEDPAKKPAKKPKRRPSKSIRNPTGKTAKKPNKPAARKPAPPAKKRPGAAKPAEKTSKKPARKKPR